MKWQWERTTSTFAFTTDACCAQVCCALAGPRRFRQFFRGSTTPCEYCFAWQGHQGARGCMPSQCSCSPHPTSALVRRSLHYCICHMYQKQEMWLLHAQYELHSQYELLCPEVLVMDATLALQATGSEVGRGSTPQGSLSVPGGTR